MLRQIGTVLSRTRTKIQRILILLVIIISIFLPKYVFPHWKKEPVDEFLDAFGIFIVLFGFLFRISARGYKNEKSSCGKELVKDGPYALLRNPMYFGTLLIGTGIIFVIFELWTFPLFFVVFFSIYMPQIKKEENKLFIRFGEEYKRYCKITPEYFPNSRCMLKLRDYLSFKLSWITKEIFSLVSVIIAIIAIEIWEDVKSFGYKEFLKEPLELSFIVLCFILWMFRFTTGETGEENK